MISAENGKAMHARGMSLSFLSSKEFWPIACVVLGDVALLKGMRLPNRWAATQVLVDYRFGVVRRGLFGQMFAGPLGLSQYGHNAVLGCVLLALMLAALVALVWVSGIFSRLGSGEPLAVFASSFALTYLGHLNGYLDIVLCLLCILSLMLKDARTRLAVAVPLSVAAILVHESYMILFLPVLLLSFVVQGAASGDAREERKTLALGGLLALVGTAVTVWIVHKPSLPPLQVEALQQQLQASTNFPLREAFFWVMSASVRDSFAAMLNYYGQHWWRMDFVASLLIFAPPVAMLLTASVQLLKRSTAAASRWVMPALFCAALAPLAMHLLGCDVSRWNTFVVVDSFLSLLVIARFTKQLQPGRPLALSLPYQRLALLVIALNLAAAETLMDNRVVNRYPFVNSTMDLIDDAGQPIQPPQI